MHLFNLLATITITFLGVQTAIALPNPMEQTKQTPQMELDNQAKQELQELLKQDFQGERCVRACYSQKPICNGAGARGGESPTLLTKCPRVSPSYLVPEKQTNVQTYIHGVAAIPSSSPWGA
ncbi:predicted protein [Histoplasma capsulatum var. duboisii H88]|uniref:Predicted protein n=1 Tax=Ajellomyces capsulatus (strain H88) TaxID=544711 RepID=F0UL22_AJEC8|nr:predicted protein [Histoplasma capsulatum var. duboisii H88]